MCVCVCVHLSVSFPVPPTPSPSSLIIIKDFAIRQKSWPPERLGFRFGQIWAPLPLLIYIGAIGLLNLSEPKLPPQPNTDLPGVSPSVHSKGWHLKQLPLSLFSFCPTRIFSVSPAWPQLVPSRTPQECPPQPPAKGSRGCGRSGLGWGPQRPGIRC